LKTHSCFPASLTFCPCRNPFTFPGGPTKHLQVKHQKMSETTQKKTCQMIGLIALSQGFVTNFIGLLVIYSFASLLGPEKLYMVPDQILTCNGHFRNRIRPMQGLCKGISP
jgi:hypothetical protein